MSSFKYQSISNFRGELIECLSLLLLLCAFSFATQAQQKYNNIEVINYRTDYPKASFLCDSVLCDSIPCDGNCFSIYENGQIYYQGGFKGGKLVDTLKVFYPNGSLKELYIPRLVHKFYNSKGFAIYEWDNKKKEEHSFYEKDRIKRFVSWSNSKPVIIKEYYINGGLKNETERNHKKIYDKDGLLIQDITRKEVWIFDRIVNGTRKWYEYYHVEYDNCGRKLREAKYKKSLVENDAFPNNIDEIRTYNMSFYYNYSHGKIIKKQTWKYQNHKGRYQKLHRTFLWKDGDWEEQVIE